MNYPAGIALLLISLLLFLAGKFFKGKEYKEIFDRHVRAGRHMRFRQRDVNSVFYIGAILLLFASIAGFLNLIG